MMRQCSCDKMLHWEETYITGDVYEPHEAKEAVVWFHEDETPECKPE